MGSLAARAQKGISSSFTRTQPRKFAPQDNRVRLESKASTPLAATTAADKLTPALAKKKLSFNEVRDLETIEKRIADAEEELRTRQNEMGDPAVMSDAARLRKVCVQVEAAQKTVEDLYARWSALEKRRAELS